MPKMTDSELKAVLQAEKLDAMGSMQSSKLVDERTAAMDYYMGDVSADMPTQDGRSKAVSSDVSDTIEGLMPSLMEVFCSAENVVQFAPVGKEDVKGAEQETDYINHVFMQKNDGFRILYTFCKDALLSKNGIVKVWWEEREKVERETYTDQTEEVFTVVSADPSVEVIKHTPNPETGLHDFTAVTKHYYKCAKVENVPPEEFGIARNAKTIRDAQYAYHETTKTQAALIAQGYDEAQIRTLQGVGELDKDEARARDTVEETATATNDINQASRKIRVTEHYIVMSYEEEDEEPQLYRVVTGGEDAKVLRRNVEGTLVSDIEPVDVMPFAAMTPVIMPHRFWGRSIADLVMDIQRIKTALQRAVLDNFYLMNNQRFEVAESHAGDRTIDDLLVNRPGGFIRTKTPGGIIPIPNQPLGPVALPMIEYFDATREWRTGVTRQGQGLDAKSLQNQTATAVGEVYNAARAKMKLIARIFAETGIRDLFLLLHATVRKNDRQVHTVQLRNTWVPINPRAFKRRDDMVVRVGLGAGSKEQKIAFLMQLLQVQREAIMAPQLGLCTPKNIYNTLEKLVEETDLKTVDPYFTDPEQVPPQEPPPDPKMVEVQGKLELEKADAQNRQVQSQIDAQIEIEKLKFEERRIQLEERMAVLEHQLREHEMLLKADLEREKAGMQMEQAQQKAQMDADFAERDSQRRAEAASKPAATFKLDAESGVGAIAEELRAARGGNDERMMQMMETMHAAIKELSRPRKTSIIRDPKTNRAIGAESV